MLENGSAWLDTQRQKLAKTVTYQRDAASVDVAATVGRTIFRVDVGYGVFERHEARDFILPAASLILSSTETLPQSGDRILETAPGKTFIYEVMAPGSEPCWRYSDPFRKTLRIHTKLVDSEDA